MKTEKNKKSGIPANDIVRLVLICLLVFNRLFYYLNVDWGKWVSDSGSFVNYDPHLAYRMFGYPLVIDLFEYILKDDFAYGVVILQIILSCASVYYLYKSMRIVLKDKKTLCMLATFLYGSAPTIMQWDMIIVTESLSLSITVLFIYNSLSWLQDYKKRHATGMIFTVFLGTIIKTALFVYAGAVVVLIILLFFFKKWRDKEERKKALGFISVLTMLLVIFDLGYCAYNYIHCGLFSMSNLSARHKVVHALRSGTYQNYSDKEMVKKIDEIYRNNDFSLGYSTTTPVLELFGDDQIEQNRNALLFARESLKSDIKSYIIDLMRTGLDEVLWKFESGYETRKNDNGIVNIVMNIQGFIFDFIRVAYVFAICLVSTIWLIIKWVKEKKCPFELLGITGGMILILFTVNIAAYSEWTRLLVYALPFVYIDAAMIAGAVMDRMKK